MNATQKRYAVAKAAFETSLSQKSELLHPYAYLLDSDDGFEEYTNLEIKFNDELKCDTFRAALRKAEDEMVAWANAKVSKSKHFSPRYKKAMNEVMAAYSKQASIRNRMIELAFRLG